GGGGGRGPAGGPARDAARLRGHVLGPRSDGRHPPARRVRHDAAPRLRRRRLVSGGEGTAHAEGRLVRNEQGPPPARLLRSDVRQETRVPRGRSLVRGPVCDPCIPWRSRTPCLPCNPWPRRTPCLPCNPWPVVLGVFRGRGPFQRVELTTGIATTPSAKSSGPPAAVLITAERDRSRQRRRPCTP